MPKPADDVAASKLISKALRHAPEAFGITLDANGWVAIDALLNGVRRHRALSRADLERIVAESDKKRFAIDGDRIRANQGHSVDVDLALAPAAPPPRLYHGTVARFLEAILREGLTPQGRHHVHLSADVETARKVGGRRGKPVILEIAAEALAAQGAAFYRSDNGVWLTAHVPPQAITTQNDDNVSRLSSKGR